jgi:hypothetical protein
VIFTSSAVRQCFYFVPSYEVKQRDEVQNNDADAIVPMVTARGSNGGQCIVNSEGERSS